MGSVEAADRRIWTALGNVTRLGGRAKNPLAGAAPPHPDVPWYPDESWSPLRGALATVDRRYGWLERVHHHAGQHVAHHLFPEVPHYHLAEATAALRPRLGAHYRVAPDPFWRSLVEVLRECRVVDDRGTTLLPRRPRS